MLQADRLAKFIGVRVKPLQLRRTEDAEMELNEISGRIIAAALKVHTAIGPGVLESVYQTCLLHELKKAGLAVQAQAALPVVTMGCIWIQAIELTSWWRTLSSSRLNASKRYCQFIKPSYSPICDSPINLSDCC